MRPSYCDDEPLCLLRGYMGGGEVGRGGGAAPWRELAEGRLRSRAMGFLLSLDPFVKSAENKTAKKRAQTALPRARHDDEPRSPWLLDEGRKVLWLLDICGKDVTQNKGGELVIVREQRAEKSQSRRRRAAKRELWAISKESVTEH